MAKKIDATDVHGNKKHLQRLRQCGWSLIAPSYSMMPTEDVRMVAGYLFLKYSPQCGKFSHDAGIREMRRTPHVEVPPCKVLITNASFPKYVSNIHKIRVDDNTIADQHCTLGKYYVCFYIFLSLYF